MRSLKIWMLGILLTGITVSILFGMFSCRHDSNEIDQLADVCFDTEILPIFQTSCAISGCHDQGGERYSFTSYENILKAVTPGDPYNSSVYTTLIKIWSFEGMMPPNQPLSEHNRTLIRVWIQQGARNTTCLPAASIALSGKLLGTIHWKPCSNPIFQSDSFFTYKFRRMDHLVQPNYSDN
jgi:hypothetical protein